MGFLAIADLWGGWHVLRWHTLRFYGNPVTRKLEPIGFDANAAEMWYKSPFVFKKSSSLGLTLAPILFAP